jgi:hypothetical protein
VRQLHDSGRELSGALLAWLVTDRLEVPDANAATQSDCGLARAVLFDCNYRLVAAALAETTG